MPYPRKRFGQHWLKDISVHEAILRAANLDQAQAGGDPLWVLEIGPGTGQLTQRLLARGVEVLAVEIDRDLCRLLQKRFADQPRFHLVEGDFLRLPLPQEPRLLVANIPYNITSPILGKVLGSPAHPVQQFERMVLLVQKELAERLQATPGSKAYGAMSVRTRYLAECELVCTVPRSAFKPSPKVESAVIRLSPRPAPVPARDPRWFNQLIQRGFSTRRKKLLNALQGLVDRKRLSAALTQLNLNPDARAEELDLPDWLALSDLLLDEVERTAPAHRQEEEPR
ncbi:16S rRNA (adenine(1518)-N(6)/adenine(1519)-N(6))-dimethyltransferase RsmA [Thermostichus vulcanus]|uniref:Ribosomal RNA small subunit methyltransferase A n=1 Tax=Thermostichus vulcanus str. 'Rupite' TaxID=2813851 RepID=A0ABT0CEX0_THEVL|nr:16S rRNA (adenine(1518)-N(6)/adenine(1519)-N(6))-dimethyltransferase RsmA [Thermostichus vulcanus]MCJ2544337.1 16S rRNA (adenine(1518)-N(6)/adenine(1519)-N(6))-dimethyltransferase RsmA [Thermostichus vulcanus str. 'Rupite']